MGGGTDQNWSRTGVVATVIAAVAAVVGIPAALKACQAPPEVSGGGSMPSSTVMLTPPPTSMVSRPPATSADGSVSIPDTGLPSNPSPGSGSGGDLPTVAAPSPAAPPPVAAQPAILSVSVVPRIGNGILTKIGQNTYELPSYPSSINPPLMTFDWTLQGPGGKVGSGDCTVSAEIVSSASGFPQFRRSSDCSGSPNSRVEIMEPGSYQVTVTVAPPDGGAPVSNSASFLIVARGG
ncbi:hypothetical protein [Mycolicibacterium iranicum]|uniref:PKD domain-containing protein n=1 Tax=Mycolicibacterium iranicum TaxID=912594 RepID=A0ABT4HKK4_MYCIR|nr:hypothetical protein [Mycolicibacterium iranicum]MCZ0730730.1 hypothetical protein [Mycolicibacterium iranicum]